MPCVALSPPKKTSPSGYYIGAYAVEDTDRTMDLHPARCAVNPWLPKFFFFVADTHNPTENGVVLASIGGVSEAKYKRFPARVW